MLVAAAFIGPGTVTACTLAGSQFGYRLLWALCFATIATIILQSLAARVAIVTGMGLAEAMLGATSGAAIRWASAVLLFIALAVGNAAYEGGNLVGAGLGLAALVDPGYAITPALAAPIFGLAAALIILIGKPRWLEYLLIVMVLMMSIAFVGALLIIRPDWSALAAGLVPSIPENSLLTVLALVGTTIVPYNLFLHAARARQLWPVDAGRTRASLASANLDCVISVAIGGLVSMAILAGAAGAMHDGATAIDSASDFALQLQPLFGEWARYAVGLGLMAAGFSSALTAPLATGYVLGELLASRDRAARDLIFKGSAVAIVAIGSIIALARITPTNLIVMAQAANGLLLPIIAAFTVWIASRSTSMGDYRARLWHRLAGWVVVLICTALGARLILRALGLWP